MFENLNNKQILLIAGAIIIILLLLYYFMYSSNRNIEYDVPVTTRPSNIIYTPYPTPTVTVTQPPQNIYPKSNGDGNTPFILYNFYNPSCGFCRKFIPSWNEIVHKLRNVNNLSLLAIDATRPENENLTFYYNVDKYPTIILVTPDKNIEYIGNRSAEDLHNFIVQHIREYHTT